MKISETLVAVVVCTTIVGGLAARNAMGKLCENETVVETTAAPSERATARPASMNKTTSPRRNIIQTAVGPGMQTVTTLVKAVQAAQLVDALQGPGPFTVFAPTNDAFAKLPAETIANLLKPENRAQLQSILLYHVHAGEGIRAAQLKNGKLSTLNGKSLQVKIDGPTVMVNGATVTKTDVIASNGVIHWLDSVILP